MSVPITVHGKDAILPASLSLGQAFSTDPTTNYILSPLSPSAAKAYMPHLFNVFLTEAVLQNTSIYSTPSFECVGLMLPPGVELGRPRTAIQAGFLNVIWTLGYCGMKRLITDLRVMETGIRDKVFPPVEKHRFNYIMVLGTVEEGRGKGLASALVRRYQEDSRKEGLPIYLEAATEYCRRLYERLGFETVGEMMIGVGKAGADGRLKKDGEGFKLWGMIWRP